jgi:hypothetical protein
MDAVIVMGLGDSWIPQGEFHVEDLVSWIYEVLL